MNPRDDRPSREALTQRLLWRKRGLVEIAVGVGLLVLHRVQTVFDGESEVLVKMQYRWIIQYFSGTKFLPLSDAWSS